MEADGLRCNTRSFLINLKLLMAAGHEQSCQMGLFLIRHALLHDETVEAREAFDALHWGIHHNQFPATAAEYRELEQLFKAMPDCPAESAGHPA
jgi:hypothetical protein